MALLLVQQALLPIPLPDGRKTQACVQIEGVSLGGQAVGSKYNTRVCYMLVMKGDRDDDPLNGVGKLWAQNTIQGFAICWS